METIIIFSIVAIGIVLLIGSLFTGITMFRLTKGRISILEEIERQRKEDIKNGAEYMWLPIPTPFGDLGYYVMIKPPNKPNTMLIERLIVEGMKEYWVNNNKAPTSVLINDKDLEKMILQMNRIDYKPGFQMNTYAGCQIYRSPDIQEGEIKVF